MTRPAADSTLCLARLALAAALLPTGLSRAFNVSGFALTLAATGMPYPNAVATLFVVLNVFGPLCLILGVLPRLSGGLLAGFSLVTAPLLHRFWDLPAGPLQASEQALFLAGFGLAGGLGLYAAVGPGGWSWQGFWHGRPAAPAPRPVAGKASAGPRPAPRKRAAPRLPKAA